MKVKRLIKSFIYLFPIICVFVTALCSCLVRLNKSAVYLQKETTGNTTTNYVYRDYFGSLDFYDPMQAGMFRFSDFMADIDDDFQSQCYNLIEHLFIENEQSPFYYFIGDFIAYEMIAILICAVFDVIFFIPEFYNKIEDKYIKGGKKRE